MPLLQFQEQTYTCEVGETVLDCLERQGATVPSSCRSGVCQTCMMRTTQGTPPAASQPGLKPTLRAQGYFLACLCKPQAAMEVALAGTEAVAHTVATVVAKERLNADILRLILRCRQPFGYQAGQFVHLTRPDGLARSYSVANLPNPDGRIELHVRRLNGGAMSAWIHDTLAIEDSVALSGPYGSCFYTPEAPEQGLLLIGTGSGLAPLWGIVADALQHGHTGPIHLYHGTWKPAGLYLVEQLQQLQAAYPNFTYVPCVDAETLPGYREGHADQIALADLPDLKGRRVYLCGHPDMVKAAKKRAFLAGASMQDIYSDPFVLSVPSPAPTSV